MDACEELELRLGRKDWQTCPGELWRWVETTPGIAECIASGLQESAAAADWLRLETLVLAGFRVPSRLYTTALAGVLDQRSGEVNNEDVVELLHDGADPEAVGALEGALWWLPDWDEFCGLGRKCIEALVAIGTEEAWRVVRDAAEAGPATIRAEAEAVIARRSS